MGLLQYKVVLQWAMGIWAPSVVRYTLELNYCTKLFHQPVHALGAKSCKTRHYTNAVCCSLKIPP